MIRLVGPEVVYEGLPGTHERTKARYSGPQG